MCIQFKKISRWQEQYRKNQLYIFLLDLFRTILKWRFALKVDISLHEIPWFTTVESFDQCGRKHQLWRYMGLLSWQLFITLIIIAVGFLPYWAKLASCLCFSIKFIYWLFLVWFQSSPLQHFSDTFRFQCVPYCLIFFTVKFLASFLKH